MLMNAQVVLIYPPICPGHKPFYSMPPMGVTSLATFLTESGITSRVIDAEHHGLSLAEVAEQALNYQPELVGISVMTPMISSALKIARIIKTKNKDIRICLGGPHISTTLGEVYRFTDDVDYLFLGESEESFRTFVKARYIADETIDGFVYRKEGQVIVHPKTKYIEDLDSLPHPDFSLIDGFNIRTYRIPYANRPIFLPIMASRGCYYNCTFCEVRNIHGQKLRTRSPENVLVEMEKRHLEQGVGYFVFKDSSLTLNREWAERVCRLMIERKLYVNWRCNARTNEVDPELLVLMKKAGCSLISYGIESGLQDVLCRLKKSSTVEGNRCALDQTHKAGIQTHAIYIIGSPGETEESIKATIKFAQKSNSLFVQFGKAIAYPQNGFYQWGLETGALEDEFWYMKEDPVRKETFLVNPHRGGGLNLPGIDQDYWIKQAIRQYYFRFRYILKLLCISFRNPRLIINGLISMAILLKCMAKTERKQARN